MKYALLKKENNKLKKLCSINDIKIVDYSVYREMNIVFKIQVDDEELAQRILENQLSEAERNFLLSTICEYVESKVKSDETLFEYSCGSIIVAAMTDVMDLPGGILNYEFINNHCMRKSKGEKSFSASKFRLLSLDQKLKCISDISELIWYCWCSDYLPKSTDICNIVQLDNAPTLPFAKYEKDLNRGKNNEENVDEIEETATASKSRLRKLI